MALVMKKLLPCCIRVTNNKFNEPLSEESRPILCESSHRKEQQTRYTLG